MTNRILPIVAVFSLVAGTAAAQTVALSVDLTQYGAWKARQVDDDGDARTPRAWLLWLIPKWNDPGERYQLVVPRANGTLCAESPFTPTTTFAHVELGEMDGRDVLMIFTPGIFQSRTTMDVVSFDRSRCH